MRTPVPQSCKLSVSVWRTGFGAPGRYVRATHANGQQVHSRCDTDHTSRASRSSGSRTALRPSRLAMW